MERNASLEEDNSKLRRERSDLALRLSAEEREVSGLCMDRFMNKWLVSMSG